MIPDAFSAAKRQALGEAIGDVVNRVGYTVWACAVLKNHVHLCVRRHRDDATTIWETFAEEIRAWLRRFADVSNDHPIWSQRPYKAFLDTPEDVRRVVAYIVANPDKEGLTAHDCDFVVPYDGWLGSERSLRSAAPSRKPLADSFHPVF